MKQAGLRQEYIPRRKQSMLLKDNGSTIDTFNIHITLLWCRWGLAQP